MDIPRVFLPKKSREDNSSKFLIWIVKYPKLKPLTLSSFCKIPHFFIKEEKINTDFKKNIPSEKIYIFQDNFYNKKE